MTNTKESISIIIVALIGGANMVTKIKGGKMTTIEFFKKWGQEKATCNDTELLQVVHILTIFEDKEGGLTNGNMQ